MHGSLWLLKPVTWPGFVEAPGAPVVEDRNVPLTPAFAGVL
jgi:hypothetical protein